MKKASFLSNENMILLYNYFFLSNISYGIEIWGNTYYVIAKKNYQNYYQKNLKFKSINFNQIIKYI